MLVSVKVVAGARAEQIVESAKGFSISVREKAERNLANARVRTLIARHFRVSLKDVSIIKGHHTSAKILNVRE